MFAFRFAIIFAIIAFVRAICDTLGHIDETCGLDIQYFGNRAMLAASNQAALDGNCKTNGEGIKCLNEYVDKCLEQKPAALAKTIMHGVKSHYEKRCQDKEYEALFIEHNQCFTDAAIFEQFHQCYDKWYHRMLELSKLGLDVSTGIKSTCCIFHEFQRCVAEKNKNLCHDKNVQFWDDTFDEVSDSAINGFCADLATSEQCSKNFPQDIWQKIDGPISGMDATALNARSGKFKSMFVTILDMASMYTLKGKN